jgi:hypothetical protein
MPTTETLALIRTLAANAHRELYACLDSDQVPTRAAFVLDKLQAILNAVTEATALPALTEVPPNIYEALSEVCCVDDWRVQGRQVIAFASESAWDEYCPAENIAWDWWVILDVQVNTVRAVSPSDLNDSRVNLRVYATVHLDLASASPVAIEAAIDKVNRAVPCPASPYQPDTPCLEDTHHAHPFYTER